MCTCNIQYRDEFYFWQIKKQTKKNNKKKTKQQQINK